MVASMLYYWVPDQRCSMNGVEKLQPGTWAEFRPDGTLPHEKVLGHRARWQPRPRPGRLSICGEVVEASVAAHLVADVPVSSFLSAVWTRASSPCWRSVPTRISTPTP